MDSESKYDKWLETLGSIIEEAEAQVKADGASPIKGGKDFDFLSLAHSRLSAKFGKGVEVQIREVYKACGCFFSFRKKITRELLKALQHRGLILYSGESVVFL